MPSDLHRVWPCFLQVITIIVGCKHCDSARQIRKGCEGERQEDKCDQRDLKLLTPAMPLRRLQLGSALPGSPAHLHTPSHPLKPAHLHPAPPRAAPAQARGTFLTPQHSKGTQQLAMQGAYSSPGCFSKQCSEHRARS